jgi:hypothetical protein
MTLAPDHLKHLARRYTEAWCSQDPARVAAFFSPDGSLRVNNDQPALGRNAITEVARGFMTAFPDMKVRMDDLLVQNGRIIYRWTLTGNNTGPGGTGHRVSVSGFENGRSAPMGSSSSRWATSTLPPINGNWNMA